ncbi:helix-hairpin-helix domain-containing protein [Streptomyces cadmiisoli]|uniref:helix-hairpin-helix domain-containing protein n=1 Tax=Streptomyces cadmiisoli TaxID=2184053 RepID=UPI003CCC7F55
MLFAERAGAWRESGAGPPGEERGRFGERGAGFPESRTEPCGRGGEAEGSCTGPCGRGGEARDSRTAPGEQSGKAQDSRTAPGEQSRKARDSCTEPCERRGEVRGSGGEPGERGGRSSESGAAGVVTASAGAGTLRERAGLALRERMPMWLQARCGLERRSVFALTGLLVVVAGFAVQHFWTGRPEPVRAPEVVEAAAPYGGQEDEPGPVSGSPLRPADGTATPGAEIVVDVTGKVRKPGIHRLPAGSRVADALHAAGGVRPGTTVDGLNRARFLVDGEQVVVGVPAPVAGPGAGTSTGTSAGAAPPAAPVSLNTATVEQLDTLPGVGPVLAGHIIDYRAEHGGFRSVDELREVNGIGERRFADLRDLVRP